MKNVKMAIKGSMLTLTIDMKQDFGVSKTGKTLTVASTGGFQPVPYNEGGKSYSLNLNLCKK